MLLQIIRNQLTEAQVVYSTLEEKCRLVKWTAIRIQYSHSDRYGDCHLDSGTTWQCTMVGSFAPELGAISVRTETVVDLWQGKDGFAVGVGHLTKFVYVEPS